MAVYKVPQDVEADDKLIGPFSFRQFIYLIIVAGAGFIGWILYQVFLPLVVIVLPVILLFGALALPLRKDQPMETYLAAIISFYIKPRRRLWNPDGSQQLVQIIAPQVVEVRRTKDISQDEAEQRLSYLAQIVDSRGWAVRGVQSNSFDENSALSSEVIHAAQTAPDMLDESAGVRQALEQRLEQTNAQRHQATLEQFRVQSANVAVQQQQPAPQVQTQAPPQQTMTPQQPVVAPAPQVDPYANLQTAPTQQQQPAPTQTNTDTQDIVFNPYPNMRQSVIQPAGEQTQPPQAAPQQPQPQPQPQQAVKQEVQAPSPKQVSPDIISLANNSDLSVETIAREANRIHDKQKHSSDEVVISLR